MGYVSTEVGKATKASLFKTILGEKLCTIVHTFTITINSALLSSMEFKEWELFTQVVVRPVMIPTVKYWTNVVALASLAWCLSIELFIILLIKLLLPSSFHSTPSRNKLFCSDPLNLSRMLHVKFGWNTATKGLCKLLWIENSEFHKAAAESC